MIFAVILRTKINSYTETRVKIEQLLRTTDLGQEFESVLYPSHNIGSHVISDS
jgi:hypothetical protein